MDSLAFLNHAVNFFAPALFLAAAMLLAGRLLLRRKRPAALPAWLQFTVNALVTGAGLVASLLIFGNDGKMFGYALAAGCCAISQWVVSGDWKR